MIYVSLPKLVFIGDDDNEQIKNGSGYDHNFVLNGKMGELRTIANVQAASSGINMEVLSTMAGVQLYTGNFLCSALAGKNNADYPKRSGTMLRNSILSRCYSP